MIRSSLLIIGVASELALATTFAVAQPDNGVATDVISLDVSRAEVTDHYPPLGGRPVIDAATDDQSTKDLVAFTRKHQGQMIEILVDNEVMFSGVLKEPMFGVILIPAATIAEANSLAVRLQTREARLMIRAAAPGSSLGDR
jgi:hypothetical protein